jgi:hypothetical protein
MKRVGYWKWGERLRGRMHAEFAPCAMTAQKGSLAVYIWSWSDIITIITFVRRAALYCRERHALPSFPHALGKRQHNHRAQRA